MVTSLTETSNETNKSFFTNVCVLLFISELNLFYLIRSSFNNISNLYCLVSLKYKTNAMIQLYF